MIEPKKLVPGQSVAINTKVSEQTHNQLVQLRTALAYKQQTHFTMAEIFQLALEMGVKHLENQLEKVAA